MNKTALDGQSFIKLVSGGAQNLKENASIVNDLNVFPIPDGDTGENMSMTIQGGLSYLYNSDENSIEKVSEILADGMLMSARGNSGVILSQFFAGIAKGLKGIEEATVNDIARAMEGGVKSAYSAVINPTEGTILTVAREATQYANGRITKESTIETYGKDFITELHNSLKRTPDLLKILKEAGVIDSGGAGLYYIFDGAGKVFNGKELKNGISDEPAKTSTDYSLFNENSEMVYGYCTEFLLQLTNAKRDVTIFDIDEFISYLQKHGDSIVAFRTGTVVKTHIHTMKPGEILNYCQQFGEFLTVKIENMTLQHHDSVVENRFEEKKEKKKYAVIAVATGEGIKDTFRDLGADYIIDGGQTNNPSTQDFVNAFDEVNAENIFVLPNNKNIIMAAKQAGSLYEKSKVYVIESKNIGDGYASLTMLSFDSDNAEEIQKELTDAMNGVVTGMVTKSIRDANINGVNIHRDEYIGFTDKQMLSSCNTNYGTAFELLKKLALGDYEYLIAIYGKETTEEEKNNFRQLIKKEYPAIEIYDIEGKQEVYDFLLILQ